MEENNGRMLSAGQFAGLCGVSKDTIFYYDRLGLVKPALREKNGYRRYQVWQVADVQIIRVMEQYGWSLEEIGRYLEQRSPERYVEMLRAVRQRQEEELVRLRREIAQIEEHLQQGILDMPRRPLCPEVVRREERVLFATPYRHDDPSKDWKLAASLSDYTHACRELLGSIRFPLGRLILRENLNDRDFMRTDALFSPISPEAAADCRLPAELVRAFPAGLYVRIMYRGAPTGQNGAPPNLFRFIEDKGLRVAGDGLEMWVLNVFASARPDDFAAIVEIPVR